MKLIVMWDSNYKLIKIPALKLAKLVNEEQHGKLIQSPKPCCAKPNERSFKTTTRKKSEIKKEVSIKNKKLI
jgi:hypothetical protein